MSDDMENTVLISLIIPVYGVEPYIGEFARSVFGQSYPHIQYIYVNDGTKDRSMEIVKEILYKEFPNREKQVVFVDKENGGLPAARRTGLDYVKGDYVYNVDPDDWLSPDAVAKIAAAIAATESDIVYFNYVKEYANRSKPKREGVYGIADKERYIRDMYNHKAYGTLCNKCIRYSLYQIMCKDTKKIFIFRQKSGKSPNKCSKKCGAGIYALLNYSAFSIRRCG